MPTPEPTLAARAILPLISGLRSLGHDPSPLLAAVGVDPAMLDDPDARVPMPAGVGLLARAAEAWNDDCIGLHVAEHADLRSVDIHFYAMLASTTLRDAYVRLSRYQRLIHDTSRVEYAAEPSGATLRHALPGGLPVPRHSAEFIVAAWVRTGRLATGVEWNPIEVRFAHAAPADVSEHARFFGAPVRFATGENALLLSAAMLALPCIGGDPALAALVDRHAGERLRLQPATASVADRLRAMLERQLGAGEPTVAAAASRLKMSVRTLHRSLAAEQTSYREVLDHLRHELATRHLANARTSIAEVAFLLGFSEISAFHRAFKRWTGQTPALFRSSATSARRPVADPRS